MFITEAELYKVGITWFGEADQLNLLTKDHVYNNQNFSLIKKFNGYVRRILKKKQPSFQRDLIKVDLTEKKIKN